MTELSVTSEQPALPRWTLFLRMLLRFQSYFGLIAIFVVAALISPERNGENVFLDSRNLLNIVRFRPRTASSRSA